VHEEEQFASSSPDPPHARIRYRRHHSAFVWNEYWTRIFRPTGAEEAILAKTATRPFLRDVFSDPA